MTSPDLPVNANPSTPSASFVVGPGAATPFVDRRDGANNAGSDERRQFGSSHSGLTEDGRELALAIDRYKVEHHRRYITCDEMLTVMKHLGYKRDKA